MDGQTRCKFRQNKGCQFGLEEFQFFHQRLAIFRAICVDNCRSFNGLSPCCLLEKFKHFLHGFFHCPLFVDDFQLTILDSQDGLDVQDIGDVCGVLVQATTQGNELEGRKNSIGVNPVPHPAQALDNFIASGSAQETFCST